MLPLLLALVACTGAPKDDTGGADTGGTADTADTAAGPGTLALSFRMDDDYIAAMAEDGQSPTGAFSGSIFAEADASSIGPNEGAVPLVDFSVPGLDLTDGGGPSEVMLVTEPLDAQIVWVLGCLDVDVPADGCGDPGDPITVPNENKVRIVAGAETPFEVYMGMLRP